MEYAFNLVEGGLNYGRIEFVDKDEKPEDQEGKPEGQNSGAAEISKTAKE
jgi:hypothetical protein